MRGDDGRVGGIVLAAGQSRRYGSDKRLARLPEGDTLLERVVRLMQGCVDEVALVIGATERESDYAGRFPGVRIVQAPRSRGGMGFSLADAVRQLEHWEACLVSLADKPFVSPASLALVRELLRAHDLVMPTYRRAWGHPVGFARQHFLALARLEGDSGGKSLIESERDHCLFVEIDDPGIVADVDTPDQLEYWVRRLAT